MTLTFEDVWLFKNCWILCKSQGIFIGVTTRKFQTSSSYWETIYSQAQRTLTVRHSYIHFKCRIMDYYDLIFLTSKNTNEVFCELTFWRRWCLTCSFSWTTTNTSFLKRQNILAGVPITASPTITGIRLHHQTNLRKMNILFLVFKFVSINIIFLLWVSD